MNLFCPLKLLFIVQFFYNTFIRSIGTHNYSKDGYKFNSSIKSKSQCGSRFQHSMTHNHMSKYDYALLSPFVSTEDSEDTKKDIEIDVVKDKIINELKQSEDIIKGVLARITDHVLQYVKHKLVQQFLRFYIINPLGMGVGNLLNTDLNDSYVISNLKMPKDANPNDFNMEYLEVDVPSNFGAKVPKRCWLIKSTNENVKSTFVLLHGWFGNMQSCLPFANIINKLGVLKNSHILILDLRDHVGRSYESNIGLKGVMDIYDSIEYMNKEFGVTDFKLYAQSISGLSALVFYDCYLKVKMVFYVIHTQEHNVVNSFLILNPIH